MYILSIKKRTKYQDLYLFNNEGEHNLSEIAQARSTNAIVPKYESKAPCVQESLLAIYIFIQILDTLMIRELATSLVIQSRALSHILRLLVISSR